MRQPERAQLLDQYLDLAFIVDARGLVCGSLPHERMERYGKLRGLSGENIGTGHADARTAVIDLFIDDGVSSRGHRDNLLEPKYKLVGVGCAAHTQWQIICVMDFAAGLREK